MSLRKLTKKSIMGFGKFQDWSVGQMLSMEEQQYLRWAYYNLSNITFFEDILEEIGIHPDIYIDKPGRGEEMFEKCYQEKLFRFKEFTEQQLKVRKGKGSRKYQKEHNDHASNTRDWGRKSNAKNHQLSGTAYKTLK